jgi:putative addiction module component (TIGR02574 family)
MPFRAIVVDELNAEQRIALMGELWDSLDATAAAPITPALAAELDWREREADGDPTEGREWSKVKAAIRTTR